MTSFFELVWSSVAQVPAETWEWFQGLNREEWLVVLIIVCGSGFASLLGFQSRRL